MDLECEISSQSWEPRMLLKLYQWVSMEDDLPGIMLEDVEFYISLWMQQDQGFYRSQ